MADPFLLAHLVHPLFFDVELAAFVTQVTVFANQGFLPQDAAQALIANAALAIARLATP